MHEFSSGASLRLDHFFILVEPGAPQADLISAIGLREGSSNRHPGQGTANRRFFCENTALELLFVCDRDEAEAGPGKRLEFDKRRATSGACPFGLVVRSDPEPASKAFPGWRYYPQYFTDGMYFQVGDNSDDLREPLCICMPSGLSAPAGSNIDNPEWRLTGLIISLPAPVPSKPLQKVAECEAVSLRLEQPHQMELVFNDARRDRSLDLAPDLPLLIRW